jgi:hypothetical protein
MALDWGKSWYWLKIRGFVLKNLENWQGKLPVSSVFVF